ncbi:MAG: hypothetical protein JOZ51_14470 [Chloroflexi bacterium]|nr:hypothetical protein [Chloroflexota bacterium]
MKIQMGPPQYVHTKTFVSEIWLPNRSLDGMLPSTSMEIPLTQDNEDFFVRLKNGPNYAFTACTPENILHVMQRDNLKSFISPGLVIVRSLEVESILDAVEACLRLTLANGESLDHYGVRQR